MAIRKYLEKDRERMRKICLETSSGFETEKAREALYVMYCDYYINEHPDTCFVVTNDLDEAIGYVISAPDFKEYKRIFKEKYQKHLNEVSPLRGILHKANILLCSALSKEYPAHLHVDILEEGQRKGYGTLLMNALFEELRGRGIKGVHLCCGSHNAKGVNFYKKYGFEIYSEKFGTTTFVKTL